MGLSKVLSAHIILASKSPRRLQLLRQMGFEVETVEIDVEEITDEDLEDYKKAEQLSIIK
ncbi:MAG: Maf family protein, partial [Bacteroidales bacterium]|nr:Maf family protein [Bacteroidales bacterium]